MSVISDIMANATTRPFQIDPDETAADLRRRLAETREQPQVFTEELRAGFRAFR